ncbi:MAG: tetratricopeptide repeat protein [Betaproteobacteria bacterium]|nr:tetratricopeptide repeat protein [Betaproteobacteria bacterium]
MRPRGRDVRLFGVAIAVGIVALGGAGLALVPSGPPVREPAPVAHAGEIDLAFRQGVAMLHARQHEHAVTAFHRVLKFSPAMPEAHANMGFALAGLGRYREAKAFFEGALDLRPRQDNAYYGLAVAAAGLGDLETARGAMRTYLHLAPEADPHRERARAALREWGEARDGTAIAASAGPAKAIDRHP